MSCAISFQVSAALVIFPLSYQWMASVLDVILAVALVLHRVAMLILGVISRGESVVCKYKHVCELCRSSIYAKWWTLAPQCSVFYRKCYYIIQVTRQFSVTLEVFGPVAYCYFEFHVHNPTMLLGFLVAASDGAELEFCGSKRGAFSSF